MSAAILQATPRQSLLAGLAIAICGAVLFSAKAIVAKLIGTLFRTRSIVFTFHWP